MELADFERCWHDHVQQVSAYAGRHVGVDAAPDVTSAVFLTAWRSWSRVPDPALPWLIAAARNQIRNHRRGARRQYGLRQRLALLDESAHHGADTAITAEDRMAALSVLASLPDGDREALLLVAWDGLTTDQAATVLGCRPGTFRTRLHRARSRLSEALEAATPVDDRRVNERHDR